MTAQTIDVAPEGWWTLAAPERFFPEDLPTDWQLTYYANVFGSVIVPATAWAGLSAQALADWRSDVHPGFRFYLAWPEALEQRQLERAAAALGDTLTGLVAASPASEPDAAAALLDPRSPGARRRIGSALRCPAALKRDLRGARDWLRSRLAAAPGERWLLILERPTADELNSWHDLLALMGLA
jgi:hypothetical protein